MGILTVGVNQPGTYKLSLRVIWVLPWRGGVYVCVYLGMQMVGGRPALNTTHFFLGVRTEGDGKGRGRQGERTAGFWVSNLGRARMPSFRS